MKSSTGLLSAIVRILSAINLNRCPQSLESAFELHKAFGDCLALGGRPKESAVITVVAPEWSALETASEVAAAWQKASVVNVVELLIAAALIGFELEGRRLEAKPVDEEAQEPPLTIAGVQIKPLAKNVVPIVQRRPKPAVIVWAAHAEAASPCC